MSGLSRQCGILSILQLPLRGYFYFIYLLLVSVSDIYSINLELNVMTAHSFCFRYVGSVLCQSVGKHEGKKLALLGVWSVACLPTEVNPVVIG
jgi:hypothetical protein